MSSWFSTINSSILPMTHVHGLKYHSEQELAVLKMSGFGIVYTLDMGLDQLLPSKIHSNISSKDKITKFGKSPSFLSLHLWKYFLCLPILHSTSPIAYLPILIMFQHNSIWQDSSELFYPKYKILIKDVYYNA